MHIAKLHTKFILAEHEVPPGEYIVEDVHAASVLILRVGEVERFHPPENKPLDEVRSCCIIRPGGIGDCLFATPIIAALAARGIDVTMCSHRRFHPILEGQPCRIADYPMLASEISEFDAVWYLENLVEDSNDDRHIVDLFNQHIGVEMTSKACRYVIADEEEAWASERYPSHGRPRVGIQVKASADSRTYPDNLMAEVGSRLVHAGFEVFLFGAPGSIVIDGKSPYVNLTGHRLSIRQSAAVLDQMDVCITPDSAFAALAGALGKPAVALYSSFPWKARTMHHPSVFALTGRLPCAPCFHHARVEPWPPGMPCATTKRCEALAQIAPETVVKKVLSLIQR